MKKNDGGLTEEIIKAIIKLARKPRPIVKKERPIPKEGDDEAASWEWVDRYKQREERRENNEYYRIWKNM
jgi:hypothetical protein